MTHPQHHACMKAACGLYRVAAVYAAEAETYRREGFPHLAEDAERSCAKLQREARWHQNHARHFAPKEPA